jgi:uncharacterized protein (TIGR03086 family)
MTMRELFPAAAEQVVRIATETPTDDLTLPTPCTDFDLHQLVNHVIGTTAALARVARREPLDPDDPYGSSQDPAHGDWRPVLAGNVSELAAAWSQPEAWEGTVDMGGQPLPAAMIGEMSMAEILLHGWDLARATGQQLAVDDEIGRELRRSVEETAELGRSMGAYAAEVPVGPVAGEFARALGASGRDPGWSSDRVG